ncbi:NAD(P)H-binding protein [Streptomyces sp. NPDC049555]|uniref:SDR family oxidoreductase n=1 Tax=unclassified Streptomyces TaxID=2593676 RepID=UPI003422EC4F
MTILVTGSRGRVGRTLIDLLHDRGLAVRAVSRKPEELDLPDGVERARLSLDEPQTFADALRGVTAVFLYAEPSHIDDFLKEAVAAGVQHIVLLSSTAVLEPDAATNPIGGFHWEAEQALIAAPVTATLLRPGHFATNALGWAPAITAGTPLRLPYPDAYTDPIHEKDIAEAALAALTDPHPTGGAYELSGPESLTFRRQAEVIGRATGRDVTIEPVTPEQWKQDVSAFMSDTFADALLGAWAAGVGHPLPVRPGVEQLTGHPARSFASWAEDHAADFTAAG